MSKYHYQVNTLFSNLMLAGLSGLLVSQLVLFPVLEPNAIVRAIEITVLSGICTWGATAAIVATLDGVKHED